MLENIMLIFKFLIYLVLLLEKIYMLLCSENTQLS